MLYKYIHDDDDDDDVNFLLMHNIMQDIATISTCNWSQASAELIVERYGLIWYNAKLVNHKKQT